MYVEASPYYIKNQNKGFYYRIHLQRSQPHQHFTLEMLVNHTGAA